MSLYYTETGLSHLLGLWIRLQPIAPDQRDTLEGILTRAGPSITNKVMSSFYSSVNEVLTFAGYRGEELKEREEEFRISFLLSRDFTLGVSETSSLITDV